MAEKWLPTVDGDGYYEVSDQGRVRSVDRTVYFRDGRHRFARGKILAPRVNNGGHLFVSTGHDGAKTKSYIHRLVMAAFVGPCPDGLEVRHLDGNPTNNHLDNLRYGTRRQNRLDDIRNGKNWASNRTHCPRGHEYIDANLIPSTKKTGGRGCLSCSRAVSYLRRYPHDEQTTQKVSDMYFEAIANGTYRRGKIPCLMPTH